MLTIVPPLNRRARGAEQRYAVACVSSAVVLAAHRADWRSDAASDRRHVAAASWRLAEVHVRRRAVRRTDWTHQGTAAGPWMIHQASSMPPCTPRSARCRSRLYRSAR